MNQYYKTIVFVEISCEVSHFAYRHVPLAISSDLFINLGLPLTESYKPAEACYATFLTSSPALAIIMCNAAQFRHSTVNFENYSQQTPNGDFLSVIIFVLSILHFRTNNFRQMGHNMAYYTVVDFPLFCAFIKHIVTKKYQEI